MSRSSSLLHACAVDVMRGKPDVGNFPACGSPGVVTPGLRRRRAYRRAYVASSRLTTTDVGLTPRLAYARVVHTALGNYNTKLLQWRPRPWWHGATATVEDTAIAATTTMRAINRLLTLPGGRRGKWIAAGDSRDSRGS